MRLLGPGEVRLRIEAALIMQGARSRSVERRNTDRYDSLQLLLGKEVLPVLVLADQLLVSALHRSLLLLELAHLLFQHLHLIPLLETASDGTLSILQSLARLFVGRRIVCVVIGAAAIDNGLVHVLSLLLGENGLRVLEACRVLALPLSQHRGVVDKNLLASLLLLLLLNCFGKLLGHFILLHLLFGHLLIFAPTALRSNHLSERVILNDCLCRRFSNRIVLDCERRRDTAAIVRVILSCCRGATIADDFTDGLFEGLEISV